MTFFVRPIIRPPANLCKNDGGAGGGGGGVQNSCIPKWPSELGQSWSVLEINNFLNIYKYKHNLYFELCIELFG